MQLIVVYRLSAVDSGRQEASRQGATVLHCYLATSFNFRIADLLPVLTCVSVQLLSPFSWNAPLLAQRQHLRKSLVGHCQQVIHYFKFFL
jgi:hypothetical protein